MTLKQFWNAPSGAVTSAGTFEPSLTPSTIRFTAIRAMRPAESPWRERPRRLLNIIVASLGLVASLPIMLLIGVLVKLSSPGPVIYKQPRVGVDRRSSRGGVPASHRRQMDHGGRLFTIYKFRTMYVDRGEARQVWASEHDPRITPVGRVLRAFRLDELPQLFNVLRGEMNIVGPRPEQPEIFQALSEEVGHYRRRQRVLPGITGLAQVSLPYDRDVQDVRQKVNLDLEYIRRRSASQDLIIMAKTMPVMVKRKGSL